jgi:hypothetical protein
LYFKRGGAPLDAWGFSQLSVSQPLSSRVDLSISIVSHAELVRQNMMNVPCSMQDSQYLDPVRSGLVENEIVLEAGDWEKAKLGQDGVVEFVASTKARLHSQEAKGCLGCVEEAKRGARVALLDVIGPAFQITHCPLALDDLPLVHPLLRSSGFRS